MATELTRSSNLEPLPRGPRLAESSIIGTVATSFMVLALLAAAARAGDEFPTRKVLTLQAALKAATAAQAEAGEDEDIVKAGAAVVR